jgi:hypothetical protein
MTESTPTNPSDAAAPGIHVDSDWKAQAEAERARLAEKEAAAAARGGPGAGPDQLPPAEFRSLVGLLASQSVMGLGTMADPQGRVVVDLEGSKFALDLLQVLQDKTKGNLTPEESGELDEVLRELRMRFGAIARMVAEQMARDPGSVRMAAPGATTPAATGGPAAMPAPASKPSTAASKLIIP